MKSNNWILYAKTPERKRFHPMDYNRGTVVLNRIHATIFTRNEADKLRKELAALEKLNPGWRFELRPTN